MAGSDATSVTDCAEVNVPGAGAAVTVGATVSVGAGVGLERRGHDVEIRRPLGPDQADLAGHHARIT